MPNLHTFQTVAHKKPQRSKWSMPFEHVFTLNEGALYPFYCEEVLPLDTWYVPMGFSARNLQTQVHPVMDDAYLDFYWFFVPSRLCWKLWPQFLGVDEPSAYNQTQEYKLPTIGFNGVGCVSGSVANGLGVPVCDTDVGVKLNALPFAGFLKIWNDWFRDESIQNSDSGYETIYNAASGAQLYTFSFTDLFSTVAGAYTGNEGANADSPSAVNKYKDLFTSCLPKPQKGGAVPLLSGYANVVGDLTQVSTFGHSSGNIVFGLGSDASPSSPGERLLGSSNVDGSLVTRNLVDGNSFSAVINRTNLVADLGTLADNTIEHFRLAIATQSYFESLARGGSRYNELLLTQFGTAPADATLQRPELIGYTHQRLSQQQAATTAGQGTVGTASAQATGTLGGYSVTGNYSKQVYKSFDEYGYIFGLAAIRVKHKYTQGVPRKFAKTGRFDFFIPEFDRLGEVPVMKSEIYAGANGVLGFQEAWYEYRHTPSRISGAVDPVNNQADLAAWTYADNLSAAPTLNSTFIRENRNNVQQTLAGSNDVPQYLVSVNLGIEVVRPMSLNGVPSTLGM